MVRRGIDHLSNEGTAPAKREWITDMSTRTVILTAFAAAVIAGPALADERISLTPTLYRDQARATATVRPASELTTVPRLVPAAPAPARVVVSAAAR